MPNNRKTYPFNPDYAVHPGEILEETLQARGMRKSDLAKRCQLTQKTISLIINGKAPITPETAIQLERVLGVAADVWNNLDANYRLHMAKAEGRLELEGKEAWAKGFPLRELRKRGYLTKTRNPVDIVEQLLDFFGVGSIETWEAQMKSMGVAYRRSASFQSSPKSVAVWLRIGELLAQGVSTAPYESGAFRQALVEIRGLMDMQRDAFDPKMKELCAQAGVALVLVSELPGTHLSGATRWLQKDKALIMLSLRHKREDIFWFTFFHEAGHILLHGKKKEFVDEAKLDQETLEEQEANRFAADELIPERQYEAFLLEKNFSSQSIITFAQSIDIPPATVVGRLQHDKKIRWNTHNNLIRKFALVGSTS